MTVVAQAQAGASVRLAPFWRQVQARLSTSAMLAELTGGRVYRASEDYAAPEAPRAPWGRLVLVPVTTLWPTGELDSAVRGINWLVRAELMPPSAPAYDPALVLEKVQQLTSEQLQGWLPPPQDGVLVRLAVYRARPPQPMPEWEPERALWWLSSEFRCEVSRL